MFKALNIDITLVYLLEKAERDIAITRVHDALIGGTLTPRIHSSYALEDCAAAHADVEAGNRKGSVLITM